MLLKNLLSHLRSYKSDSTVVVESSLFLYVLLENFEISGQSFYEPLLWFMIYWVNKYFEKEICNFFTRFVLGEGKGQWLKPGYQLVRPKGARKSLSDCNALKESCMTSKQLYAINVFSWISTLFMAVQGIRRNNYPLIHFLVHVNMMVQILSLYSTP